MDQLGVPWSLTWQVSAFGHPKLSVLLAACCKQVRPMVRSWVSGVLGSDQRWRNPWWLSIVSLDEQKPVNSFIVLYKPKMLCIIYIYIMYYDRLWCVLVPLREARSNVLRNLLLSCCLCFGVFFVILVDNCIALHSIAQQNKALRDGCGRVFIL